MRMTVPLNSSLFNDSQSGTARLVAISRFFVASWRETLLFFTTMASFTFGRTTARSLCGRSPDMAVRNHLARGAAGIGKAEAKNDVIEACLQKLEDLFAGDTAAVQRLLN